MVMFTCLSAMLMLNGECTLKMQIAKDHISLAVAKQVYQSF
jgi:hypothetical protein